MVGDDVFFHNWPGISDAKLKDARLVVRRFLCKSVFVFNTEVVWFEVRHPVTLLLCCEMSMPPLRK